MVTEEEESVETTMRGRKAMARRGRAEEDDEINVDTRQQISNKVRKTEAEKRIAILNGKEFSFICLGYLISQS